MGTKSSIAQRRAQIRESTELVLEHLDTIYFANHSKDPAILARSIAGIEDRARTMLDSLRDDHGEDIVITS